MVERPLADAGGCLPCLLAGRQHTQAMEGTSPGVGPAVAVVQHLARSEAGRTAPVNRLLFWKRQRWTAACARGRAGLSGARAASTARSMQHAAAGWAVICCLGHCSVGFADGCPVLCFARCIRCRSVGPPGRRLCRLPAGLDARAQAGPRAEVKALKRLALGTEVQRAAQGSGLVTTGQCVAWRRASC